MMTIVQHGTGPALEMHERFGARTEAWAKRHAMDYVFSNRKTYTDRKPHWEKPRLVLEVLESSRESDEVMWIDSDTVVIRQDVSPKGVLLADSDFALCADKAETPFNTGVFIARPNNRVKKFLKDVIDCGPMSNIRYHDQSRICERMPHHPQMKVQMLPLEWNFAGCTDWAGIGCQDPIIRAFHGWPRDKAINQMAVLLGQEKEALIVEPYGVNKILAFPSFSYVNADEFGRFVEFESSASHVEIENMGKEIVYFKFGSLPKSEFANGQSHLNPGEKRIFEKQSVRSIGLICERNTSMVHVIGLRG